MSGKELPSEFDIVDLGTSGNVDVLPKNNKQQVLAFHSLPNGVPPVFKSLEVELEELLKSPERLPIHDLDRVQTFWPREMQPEKLFRIELGPRETGISVDRDPTTGKLIGFKEEIISTGNKTTRNSMSLQRRVEPGQGVKGSSTNFPFWPGGLDEPNIANLIDKDDEELVDFDKIDLLSTPPGFQSGMDFPRKSLSSLLKTSVNPTQLKLSDVLGQTDLDFDLNDDEDEVQEEEKKDEVKPLKDEDLAVHLAVDEIIQLEHKDSLSSEVVQKIGETRKEEWAVKVDVNTPVADFHKRIPDMAYKWPFELDVFQKQAILHLENHDNVFVAAHTSAGKTVVAEYAIALSMKHMTRSIYTSPIKALSNQKFRDFKQTFGDVGLITGDVQIHQEASCLIMTTEILRSMLYNGSDVIRDLEWVIFDEVHYINDAERGVVWEEVLIMLPQHVNIILLSATVPNSMEFADWVGRIKKRKVYVVSTTKRPVPLEHFLYTGNSTKTITELFCILDATKNFLTTGYSKALEAKKERASKVSQNYGAKNRQNVNPQQDKNVWLSVIEMLKKKDKLPVVAFTFSKKRIEDNANHLTSVDLTTTTEKSEIHVFFQKCISRLKGSDRELPQVKHMAGVLKRGIGIHHSGVLPILKEVVEMLFQRGLVKILFATETFAMGVNMPARTVVFDSIRKHDGTEFRELLPGEYIQMAGRAGRRGLDTTGTVIILCKGDVPEMADLHKMMTGKPTLLTSQFRLTYSMILNLLRVEQLRVEDMMKRSFSEFHNQKDMSKHQESLQTLSQCIQELPDVLDYSGDLEKYYDACDEFWKLKTRLHEVMMSHPQTMKCLTGGRVVVIDNDKHDNSLGIVLQAGPASARERTFSVLVLCEQNCDTEAEFDVNPEEADQSLPKPVVKKALFYPEGACGHEMISVKRGEIAVVTTKVIKVNADKVVDDIKKRQMPRFRHDPPSQSTSVAAQELMRLVEQNPQGLPEIDPVKDLNLRDMDLIEDFTRLKVLEDSFPAYECIHEPSFNENFRQLKANMKVKEEHKRLQYLLSDESLLLLPEYEQRVEVLKRLEYVDCHCTVQLKGRVACEISNHELIITELVLDNALTNLHPTEMAAVLSCVVLEQKRCSEPNLTPDLKEAKETFLKVATKIGEMQKECGLNIPVDDYLEGFRFGLMEVVFEWARGMPFSDITGLTDVQEGIIVRCIQRLDEVLKDVRNAARIIGDPVLYQKMEEASRLIKRDIVFAASLYTQ